MRLDWVIRLCDCGFHARSYTEILLSCLNFGLYMYPFYPDKYRYNFYAYLCTIALSV